MKSFSNTSASVGDASTRLPPELFSAPVCLKLALLLGLSGSVPAPAPAPMLMTTPGRWLPSAVNTTSAEPKSDGPRTIPFPEVTEALPVPRFILSSTPSSLFGLVRAMAAAGEFRMVLPVRPVTCKAPSCDMPAAVTVRSPPTVVSPNATLPATVVRLPVIVPRNARLLSSEMLRLAAVTATLLKSLAWVNVTSAVPAFTVVAPRTLAAAFCVMAPEVFSVRLAALMAPSTSALVSVMLTAPPVAVTVLKSLDWVSVTSPVPAFTFVAPRTVAAPVWVTASFVVVTCRLAALPAPVAPMAPSTVAISLTITTAPVPVELIGPARWLPVLSSVTSAVPAFTVVAPLTAAASVCVSVPEVFSARLVAWMAPSTSALLSVMLTAPAVTVTLLKLLAALFSVTFPVPASTVVTPLATEMEIAVPSDWVILPFPAAVFSVNVPVAVTLLASVNAPLACSVMLVPLS